jgi:hypothetical protein
VADAAREEPALDVLMERFEKPIGRHAGGLYARGAGCQHCMPKSGKIGIPGISGRRLVAEILLPDQRICDLLRDRQFDAARRVWLVERGGQSMALAGHPYLLAGEIGVQEWVAYIGSAEDLDSDLAFHAEARAS